MFSVQDLNELFQLYSELDATNDGFVETRIALRDQIRSRGEEDIMRAAHQNIV